MYGMKKLINRQPNDQVIFNFLRRGASSPKRGDYSTDYPIFIANKVMNQVIFLDISFAEIIPPFSVIQVME